MRSSQWYSGPVLTLIGDHMVEEPVSISRTCRRTFGLRSLDRSLGGAKVHQSIGASSPAASRTVVVSLDKTVTTAVWS